MAIHLSRIEACVRRRIGDSSLDSDTIARACGISVRYLHDLFRDVDTTLGEWIRDQRLEAYRQTRRELESRISARFGPPPEWE